jgi:hypothetical protein
VAIHAHDDLPVGGDQRAGDARNAPDAHDDFDDRLALDQYRF